MTCRELHSLQHTKAVRQSALRQWPIISHDGHGTEQNRTAGHRLSAAAEHSSPMNKARSLKLQLACFLEHVILQDRHHWLPILTNKCMLSYNRLCTMNVEHNTSSQEELRTQNFSYGSCYWRWTVKCLSQLNAPPVSDRDVLRSVIFYFLFFSIYA